jgi:hypothetical protein
LPRRGPSCRLLTIRERHERSLTIGTWPDRMTVDQVFGGDLLAAVGTIG